MSSCLNPDWKRWVIVKCVIGSDADQHICSQQYDRPGLQPTLWDNVLFAQMELYASSPGRQRGHFLCGRSQDEGLQCKWCNVYACGYVQQTSQAVSCTCALQKAPPYATYTCSFCS